MLQKQLSYIEHLKAEIKRQREEEALSLPPVALTGRF